MKLLIKDRTPIIQFNSGVQKRVEKLSFDECVSIEQHCNLRIKDTVHAMQSILQRNQIDLYQVEPERYISNPEDKEQFMKLIEIYNQVIEWKKIVVFKATELNKVSIGNLKKVDKKLKKKKTDE